MNANELADFVEISKPDDKTHQAIATMLRKQQEEIEYWKEMFEKAMKTQEIKPAKYSDEWWKEVAEFNKQLKAQENGN
jgi:molybdopterin-biosynthesis enzyme MoeA-like protein